MPAGYSRLAALMGAHPETAIFRRFGPLNALNLLYLQAELTNLENALHEQAKIDNESGQFERSVYTRDWQTLSESVTAENGNPAQWHLMLKIRDKLNEYNQTIYFQHMAAKIEPPNKQDLLFLQTWMKAPSMGNVYLLGADSDVWERFDFTELACIRLRKSDGLIAWLFTNSLVRCYHHLVGYLFKYLHLLKAYKAPDSSDIHRNTVHYSQDAIVRLSAVLCTVIASLLLVGSIAVLHFVNSMNVRLIFIGLFTAIFSSGLGFLTNGRMVEIFSATAAFAAVQVVFVGSTSPLSTS